MKNFRKMTAVSTALLMGFVMTAVQVQAEETTKIPETKVFVTIADASGKLALVQKPVTVTDTDNDGALTINDALYLAHEAYYDGGAAAGYASEQSQYGLSLAKLWGTANGGSYGYYVNNAASMGLGDTLQDGDYLNAFVYTDTVAWSDAYSFFSLNTAEAQQGGTLKLTLFRAGYDETWNPVTLPVENAVITINGEDTAFVTDADGKVNITLENAGELLLSAKSENLTLVPPACVVTVTETSGSILWGDADCSGKVDILDVITINKAILNKESLSQLGLLNADINQNQKPDSEDSLNTMKLIVGLLTPETLPAK